MGNPVGQTSRFRFTEQDGCKLFDLREFSALVDRSYGSDILVIAFANAPMPAHSLRRADYWGSVFLSKGGLDHVALSGRANSWYRSDIVTNFLREVAGRAGYSKVVTYGVSKGGTGALWHAGAAGATEIFALVPQVTYGPEVLARGDDRWPTASYHDWPVDELRASLHEVRQITILTDTRNAFERAHLEELRTVWPHEPRVVDMRYAGHDCAAMLGRQRGISWLFRQVVTGPFDASDVRQITELRKREAGYFKNLLSSRRVSGSALRKALVSRVAGARGLDPNAVRMDSAYRRLWRLGRY